MRRNLFFALALVLCLMVIAPTGIRVSPVVRAQDKTCDATSLTGAFGYSLTGTVYDQQYYTYLLGAAGRMTADGNGNLTGADTYNFDGTIAKRQYTGSYTVNADCTGSLSFTTTNGNATHADFAIVNNGKEVNLVQTDAGWILTGVMKLQNQ